MKINHAAIRSTIKVIALTAFIASIMWRLYNLMRYGGSLDKQHPQSNDAQVDEDEDDDGVEVEEEAVMSAPVTGSSTYYADSESSN